MLTTSRRSLKIFQIASETGAGEGNCVRVLFWKEALPSSSFLPGHPLTSDLLFQVEYNVNGLLQYDQFGLGFLIAHMELTHAAQLLKSLIDVPHTKPLTGVVCQPPHFLPLNLNPHWHICIVFIVQTGGRANGTRGWRETTVWVQFTTNYFPGKYSNLLKSVKTSLKDLFKVTSRLWQTPTKTGYSKVCRWIPKSFIKCM